MIAEANGRAPLAAVTTATFASTVSLLPALALVRPALPVAARLIAAGCRVLSCTWMALRVGIAAGCRGRARLPVAIAVAARPRR